MPPSAATDSIDSICERRMSAECTFLLMGLIGALTVFHINMFLMYARWHKTRLAHGSPTVYCLCPLQQVTQIEYMLNALHFV